jgi:hypothetical protein
VLLTACGLVGMIGFGAFYGRFTEAAPATSANLRTPQVASSAAPLVSSASSAAIDDVAPVASAVSPEAERLEARRQLYENVDALVQASEFEKARRLLDEDQARYGDDLAPPWHDLEQSYRLIADCLEHPSAKLRARARAFALVSEAVSVKPRILRACGVTP